MTDNTDRARLLSPVTAPVTAPITNNTIDDSEISPPRNYGSIQTSPESPEPEEMDDSKTTLKFLEKVGFSLGHVYNGEIIFTCVLM